MLSNYCQCSARGEWVVWIFKRRFIAWIVSQMFARYDHSDSLGLLSHLLWCRKVFFFNCSFCLVALLEELVGYNRVLSFLLSLRQYNVIATSEMHGGSSVQEWICLWVVWKSMIGTFILVVWVNVFHWIGRQYFVERQKAKI